jgi:hypothetical protein
MAAIFPSVDECKQDMIELFYGLPMLATWPGQPKQELGFGNGAGL